MPAKTPEAARAAAKKYRAKNRDAILDRRRESERYAHVTRYGLTKEDYLQMLAAQGGVCAICKQPCSSGRLLAVDHDHKTGQVRGLLCGNCNRGLGNFRDSTDLLARAADYLKGT